MITSSLNYELLNYLGFSLIRLELCHDLLGYYTELDAIVIHGCEVPPPSPKHSADDLEDTVRNLEQVHITCVDESDTQTSPDGQFDNLPVSVAFKYMWLV